MPGNLSVTGAAYGTGVTVAGFEYSIGAAAAAAGTGTGFGGAGGQVATATIASPFVAPTDILWVRVRDSLARWSPAVGLPTTTAPALVGAGPDYRRFTGTATSHSASGIVAVEYALNAPSAPGSGINVPLGAQSGNMVVNYNGGRTNAQPAFPTGTVIWVRVQDGLGIWGQAVSVTVP